MFLILLIFQQLLVINNIAATGCLKFDYKVNKRSTFKASLLGNGNRSLGI
jgi:hypothetical protein